MTKKQKTMTTNKSVAVKATGEAWPMLATSEGASFAIDSVREMGLGLFDLPRLKTPTGGETAFKVTRIGGDEYEKSIDVVILAARKGQKAWYRKSIEDSDGNLPPDCVSSDGINGYGKVLRETDNWQQEVAAQHSCLDCPWDKFGSKEKGKGKACRDFAQLLVATVDGGVPTLVTVSPASLRALTAYSIELVNARKRPYQVVTRLSLERVQGPPDFARMVFTFVEDTPPEALGMVAHVSSVLKEILFRQPVAVAARDAAP